MKVSLFVIVALLMTATVATAQHQHALETREIKGSEHPELIPDERIYLEFFKGFSSLPDADDEDRKQVEYKLHRLNFKGLDEAQFRLEVGNFRVKFEKLNRDYTKLAEKGLAGSDVFWAGVAQLIAESRNNLKKGLSPLGQAQFDEGIRTQRMHTTLYIGGVQ